MKNITIPISIGFAVRDGSLKKAIVTTKCRLFEFLGIDYIMAISKFGVFCKHRKIDLVPIQNLHGRAQNQINNKKIK